MRVLKIRKNDVIAKIELLNPNEIKHAYEWNSENKTIKTQLDQQMNISDEFSTNEDLLSLLQSYSDIFSR